MLWYPGDFTDHREVTEDPFRSEVGTDLSGKEEQTGVEGRETGPRKTRSV